MQALISGKSQSESSKEFLDLQNSVKCHLNLVNLLIKEQEEKLLTQNVNKTSCSDEFESCFQWLKNVTKNFPDTAKESMEENLAISTNIATLIKEKESWVNSVVEKTLCLAKDLPKEEKDLFEKKVEELKRFYEEIKTQAECHVDDLHEKTNEKRKVEISSFFILSSWIGLC